MKIARTLSLFVALFVASFALSACLKKEEESSPTPAPATTQKSSSPSESTTSAETSSKSLSTTAAYESPAGAEEVGITLKVDSQGIILDSDVEVKATAPMSKLRQSSFRDGLDNVVVGKKLAELTSIDRVGGSSLTTAAFNKALAELQQQAQM